MSTLKGSVRQNGCLFSDSIKNLGVLRIVEDISLVDLSAEGKLSYKANILILGVIVT